MKTGWKALLVGAVLIGLEATAHAEFKVRNLEKEAVWYATGARDSQTTLWVSEGWKKLEPKQQIVIPAGTYIRLMQNGTKITPPGGEQGTFWAHSSDVFEIQQSNDGKEVHRRKKRTTTATLKKDGYAELQFSRFQDGTVKDIGSYYKVTRKQFSFGHSTSGVKTEPFSYLDNAIIDYSVAFSSKRGASGESWHWKPGDRSVSYVVTLKGGSFPNEWRPSFKGTVTIHYVWR